MDRVQVTKGAVRYCTASSQKHAATSKRGKMAGGRGLRRSVPPYRHPNANRHISVSTYDIGAHC